MDMFLSNLKKAIKYCSICIVLILNSIFGLFGMTKLPTGIEVDMSKFKETPSFADEFDGTEVDTSLWWGPQNSIRRGGYWDTRMCEVYDGQLHMKTAYKPDGIDGNNKPGWYSAELETSKSFKSTYGYYECRCKVPAGVGHWSAFWIYDSCVCNVDGTGEDGAEIDIMESAFWKRPDTRYTTQHAIHIDGYGDAHQSETSGLYQIYGDPYNEFHTYGLEWNEEYYIFYIDGVQTYRTKFGGTSKVPEYMILSVEIGCSGDSWTGVPGHSWAGDPIDTNEGGNDFTSDFVVDYVRYYEYK